MTINTKKNMMAHYATFRAPLRFGAIGTKPFTSLAQSVFGLVILLLVGISLNSCGSKKSKEDATYEERTNRNGGDDLISVNNDDQDMNSAIEKAKATLADFEKALKSNN